MKTYENMSKRMTEKHIKSCTENIQKTYENIWKYVKKDDGKHTKMHTENI